MSHRPIDQFNRKVRQQHFGTYISTRQQKLHKELSEMLLSLRSKHLEYTDVVDDKESSEDEDESMDEPILQPFPEEHKAIAVRIRPQFYLKCLQGRKVYQLAS